MKTVRYKQCQYVREWWLEEVQVPDEVVEQGPDAIEAFIIEERDNFNHEQICVQESYIEEDAVVIEEIQVMEEV